MGDNERMPSPRPHKTYDHRLRDLVRNTGDLNFATEMGVPRSTAASWLTGPRQEVVSVDAVSMPEQELQARVVRLRHQIRRLNVVGSNPITCSSQPLEPQGLRGFFVSHANLKCAKLCHQNPLDRCGGCIRLEVRPGQSLTSPRPKEKGRPP